jgi:hypothetical protein
MNPSPFSLESDGSLAVRGIVVCSPRPPELTADGYSTKSLGNTHPDSPERGTIVRCTDKSRRLTDPKGYRVEELGWSKGYGVPYGSFAACGVAHGGRYLFRVDEWETLRS